MPRTEYGVRRFGGHIEPKISMHVATREVERRLAEGEKNVWLVERAVTDWQRHGLSDLQRTEALRPGDACEFHYPARREWLPGVVIENGGSYFWSVRDESDVEGRRGRVTRSLYIEQVRAVGTDPWGHG